MFWLGVQSQNSTLLSKSHITQCIVESDMFSLALFRHDQQLSGSRLVVSTIGINRKIYLSLQDTFSYLKQQK